MTGIRSANTGSDQPMSTECSSMRDLEDHHGSGEDEVRGQHLPTGPPSSWSSPSRP